MTAAKVFAQLAPALGDQRALEISSVAEGLFQTLCESPMVEALPMVMTLAACAALYGSIFQEFADVLESVNVSKEAKEQGKQVLEEAAKVLALVMMPEKLPDVGQSEEDQMARIIRQMNERIEAVEKKDTVQ